MGRRLLPLVFVAACGSDPSVNTHCSGFVGEVDAGGPEIEIMTIDPSGTPLPMTDGAQLPLIQPPQGGRVVFAGVRVRNIDTCPVQLTGVLRNLDSNKIALESRPVNFLAGNDGWAYPEQPNEISSYTNVAVCPNAWSTKDIYGQTYQLEVAVKDKAGRTAKKTTMVTPYCAEPKNEAVCRCICHVNYTLGQCPGESDAGPQ